MSEYELHEPTYSGTTTDGWEAPDEAAFEADDLGEIDDHFLLSLSGFPPERFDDLALPVVTPEGKLNLHALRAARNGPEDVESINDLPEETAEDAKRLLARLLREGFDGEETEDGDTADTGRLDEEDELREVQQRKDAERQDQLSDVRYGDARENADPDMNPDWEKSS